MTRSEILTSYEAELVRIGKSEATIKNYIKNIELFLDWLEKTEGEAFTLPITEFSIREYTGHLTTHKLEKTNKYATLTTINAKLSAISSFCDFLHMACDCPVVKVQKKKGHVDPKVEVLNKN